MLAKDRKRGRYIMCACLALLLMGASLPTVAQEVDANGLTFEDRSVLQTAVGKWIKGQTDGSENRHGKKAKRGYASKDFRPAGDGTYGVTVHLETAGDFTKTTERYLLTMRRSGDDWEVAENELKDSFAGTHRESGASCVPFDSMAFDREGLHLSGGSGTLCKTYFQDAIAQFAVQAADMTYRFEPPEHANALHLQPDFHALYDTVKKDHERELEFKPQAFIFACDPETCAELIESCFKGVNEEKAGAIATFGSSMDSIPAWAKPLFAQITKERQATPFVHFREPVRPGNRNYQIFVLRQIDPFQYPGFEEGLFDMSSALPGAGVLMSYDNWGGFEVTFDVYPRSIIDPEQLFGRMYGWYTEETQRNSTPYELEIRDDLKSRWHQVETLDGSVDMGIDDPETLAADITFGIELKQPLRILPFFIQSIPTRSMGGKNKARELFVNSVQLDGEELTWVRTSQLGGLVVLPEEMPAGTRINLRMDFKTRAMVRYTYSFTVVSRFGWMPFVRFGDFIDEFELTVRAPSKYEVLGIGHEVERTTEGAITTTRWVSDSPIVFPSMTLGRYKKNDAGKKFKPATKSDGTPIPIVVHVDEASALDWDITTAKLQPIAQTATNAINLYTEISGLEYPYGKLDFVNDPQGFLYGQAPSSIIYLGQGVFRGEGFLATLPIPWDATGIAKFLKSVVAHEVGHQWWGSRVSNANDRNYWFVETLAEYFSAIYLEMVYGKKEYLEQVEEWRRKILDARLKSSVQNASVIWSGEGGNYQAAVYNKGPLAFHMLREIFGDEKFFEFLKAFSQELDAKREIVTLDIQQAAETNLGGIAPDGSRYAADLGWFFDQWIRGSGIPQYRLDYEIRQAEDRSWIIEGTIGQRVIVGSKRSDHVLDGIYYRGVANLTVKTGKNEYKQRMVIQGAETPFQLKVPEKPLDVVLNKHNDILSHDVLVNRGEW